MNRSFTIARAACSLLIALFAASGIAAAQTPGEFAPARLEQRSFMSAIVGSRTFYLYLPPGYDSTAERYPVVVLLRGVETEWITPTQDAARRGSIMTVADSLWRAGTLSHLILVMPRIDSPPTWNDASYIADELLPWIDARYRTLPTRSRRAVDGFSYGGLGSVMLITHAPERFISAGGYDGSLFLYDPTDLKLWDPARRAWYSTMQFQLTTTGLGQTGNQSTNRALVDTLSKYGIPNRAESFHLAPDAQHNWYFADLHVARTLPQHARWMSDAPEPLEVHAQMPGRDTTVSGLATISWIIPSPPPSLRVFLQWSRDGGRRWHRLAESFSADSSITWNTADAPDGTRYHVRLIATGDTSFRDIRTDGLFTVDNPGNGAPDVDLFVPKAAEFSGPVTLRWRAKDPEGDALAVAISVSNDDGVTWTSLASGLGAIDSLTWTTADFSNGDRYRLQLQASDGQMASTTVGPRFRLSNARSVVPYSFTRLTGQGDVEIEARAVQTVPEFGTAFRLTFHHTPTGIQYTVRRAASDSLLVPSTPLGSAADESPVFDGKRIAILAVDTPQVWQDSTRWIVGTSLLTGLVSLPTVNDGVTTLVGVPTAEDYEITVTAEPADTSLEALGVPAQPVCFRVRTVGSSVHPDFIFVDADLSGGLSHGDEVYFVPSGSMLPIQLGWSVQFTGPAGSALPQPGDVFRVRIRKPPGDGDAFLGTTTWLHAEDAPAIPEALQIDPAYPNPFNASTEVRFRTSVPSHVTLEVVDLLGRRVATLVNDELPAGEHRARWTADGVASGVYVLRVRTGSASDVRRVMLLK